MTSALPAAPASVADASGTPLFGTYQGSLQEVDFRRLGGAFRASLPRRLARTKRWLYAFTATPEVTALFAVADLSYSANAFLLVLDRGSRRVLCDRSWLVPPGPFCHVSARPGPGLSARFFAPGASLSVECPKEGDRYRLDVHLPSLPLLGGGLRWRGELLLAGGPPPITVIAPVSGGGLVNVTQKAAALLAFGSLEVAGRRFVLDGGVGGTDYTHGLLARRTRWRWAFACGRLGDGTPLALNLVEGFNDESETSNENALWVGGRLIPLSRARFTYNPADPLDPWSVATAEGELELTFRPVAAHREHKELKVVKSAFVQPVGSFFGRLQVDGRALPVEDLPGVTEDQDVLW